MYGGPEVTGSSTNKGSNSGSVSRSFDYTGMDEAAKVTQALQAAEGSFIDVALSDPMKLPTLQNSIRSMQQYLAAYNSGNGLPPVRVSSESISSSSSPGSTSQSVGRKKLASHMLTKQDDEQQEGPQQPALNAPVDNRNLQTDDTKPLVRDAAWNKGPDGISSDQLREDIKRGEARTDQKLKVSDQDREAVGGLSKSPPLRVDDRVPRRQFSTFSPRVQTQEPPKPGLGDSASIWDLDYYV